ncbi:MAG: MBL fold metallo-hydrolase [Gemmatimonadetes bacterium]|nr:MBL fold metallo-hydrolase [Gemmatimonadota bacterium]
MIQISTAAPGVQRWRFWTRVSRSFGYDVSAYALDGGVLIDSGFRHGWKGERQHAVQWAGKLCTLTHHDEDHAGGAPLLASHGARILAPEGARPLLRVRRDLYPYQRLVWGTPRPVEAEPLPEMVPYDGRILRVVATPGHSHDHVVFFEPERRWLFSGDLFIGVRLRLARRHENLPQLINSLRSALALEPDIMFDAHAGVVSHAGSALGAKVQWLLDLQGEARRLRTSGHSVPDIRRRLLGREGPITWMTFGDFSKENVIRSLLGE